MWLLKIDKKGNLEYQGLFGERYYNDGGSDIIQTADNSFVLVGYTQSADKKTPICLLLSPTRGAIK
ncbi:MAG: hypothetical protein HC896_07435 [Bacteroidales bacterium]|nr:hypothetical protein [Bacteroidales bacterium]